jgi:hypothetical protein
MIDERDGRVDDVKDADRFVVLQEYRVRSRRQILLSYFRKTHNVIVEFHTSSKWRGASRVVGPARGDGPRREGQWRHHVSNEKRPEATFIIRRGT